MSHPKCPHCQSEQTVKNGTAKRKDGSQRQCDRCRKCGKRFNERTKTPMARLRTDAGRVAAVLNVRSEGLGVRATGRAFDQSHATIIKWERRVAAQAKALWKLASVRLQPGEASPADKRRKVWCYGVEVAMKVKGSQGRPRVVWIKPEHPDTAISATAEVQANHNEAQNAALRRQASAYRRRQNL